jgi:hypothetical protein
MRHFIWLLLFAAVMIPVSLRAQTNIVVVQSDADTVTGVVNTQGNLNTAIGNVIKSDSTNHTNVFSNTVFKLQHNGYYILTGTITTPAHSHFYLEGPTDLGSTQGGAMPMIVWTTSGGVSTTYNFDCYGDVTMKNVWILEANVSGAQVGSSLVIEDDSLADVSGGKGENASFDGCIVDYMSIGNGGGAIEPACKHFRCHITNTYFRNMTDTHYRYYGRPVSWTYNSTTWHTDTITFENCSIANVGYAYMQESPEYADYVSFNHCTFLNTIVFTLESSYWWWLSVTNCVFVDCQLFADIPGSTANLSPNGGSKTPNGGAINIDSISTFSLNPPAPFTDSTGAAPNLQRHILFAYNSYGYDTWYTNFLANNSYNSSVADSNKAYLMPMMSGKTYRYFFAPDSAGNKRFPYIEMAHLYPTTVTGDTSEVADPASNPNFSLEPTNIAGIEAYLIARWKTGLNLSWAYDTLADIQQQWPIFGALEDLSYSNTTLQTAAMGGLPLGDLFHWWGSFSGAGQYATWLAGQSAEETRIGAWLTEGQDPSLGIVNLRPGVPANYELDQNYPNPFNPTTQINYSVPKNGFVTLKVYNVLGQEVATLFSGVQRAGNYAATFDGTRYASGVYFYRLQAGNVSMTKKLVLMK